MKDTVQSTQVSGIDSNNNNYVHLLSPIIPALEDTPKSPSIFVPLASSNRCERSIFSFLFRLLNPNVVDDHLSLRSTHTLFPPIQIIGADSATLTPKDPLRGLIRDRDMQ